MKYMLDSIWNRPGVMQPCHITSWFLVKHRWGLWYHLAFPYYANSRKGRRVNLPKPNRLGRSAYSWYPKGFWGNYHHQHNLAIKSGTFKWPGRTEREDKSSTKSE